MTANYWEGSQGKYWTFKRYELREAPAFLLDTSFITPRERAKLKIHFSTLIHKLGRKLHVRQQVVSTALIYFKRYFARNPFRKSDPMLIAATCLYLASKVEECPVHIKNVVAEMKNVMADAGGFPHDPSRIAESEFYLLEELSFYTIIYHPYRSLSLFCTDIGADSHFLQTAWMLVNDCYRSDIPLLYPPYMIALCAILVTAGLQDKSGVSGTSSAAIVPAGNVPPELEKWFGELNVDVNELVYIAQELFDHLNIIRELKDEDCMHIFAKLNRDEDATIVDVVEVTIDKFQDFKDMPALVLVTGVTGYLGAHVARECLENGYIVRGTLRSIQKGDHLKKIFAAHGDRFQIVEVPDIAVDHAFDEAVKGADYVIHTASPFHYNVTDVYKDLIDPAVKGTTGILHSIVKYAPTVKRVVITSSMAAIRSANPVNPAGLSEEDWNELSLAELKRLGNALSPMMAYPASKTLAEKSAWEFMKASPRSFDLCVNNPPFIFGPPIHEVAKYEDLNTSVKIISDYLIGATPVRNVALGFVDVRDVATAHVRSLVSEKASGKRILVSAGTCSHYEIVDVLSKRFPDRPVIKYSAEAAAEAPKAVRELNERSKEVLGMTYIGLEKTLVETVEEVLRRFF
ncbi:methylglyoxal reductase (NADPH-dependent) gre2 [Dinochytrium kinnereticum]|nr:methylglyoxal reductase (NADPH-dependent) gre2 [Dinochytrium kinnereticum]